MKRNHGQFSDISRLRWICKYNFAVALKCNPLDLVQIGSFAAQCFYQVGKRFLAVISDNDVNHGMLDGRAWFQGRLHSSPDHRNG